MCSSERNDLTGGARRQTCDATGNCLRRGRDEWGHVGLGCRGSTGLRLDGRPANAQQKKQSDGSDDHSRRCSAEEQRRVHGSTWAAIRLTTHAPLKGGHNRSNVTACGAVLAPPFHVTCWEPVTATAKAPTGYAAAF